MFKLLKKIAIKIDHLFCTLFPVLPKFSDNFAFKNDEERKAHYSTYISFENEPVEKFSVMKLAIFIVKALLIYIFLLFIFILYYFLFLN
jgi:hypothetical protein